ncbi:MAG: carbohydrate kinase family protein, partial [Puniceicoccales bacterium]|nr:carbohydrate kinase family protein [Puniceicoccales bacterium]
MQTGKILETLKARKTDLKHKKAFVGWDGFVDKISVAVDRRWGEGTRFSKIKTVRAFSQRIAAASSRNTNIEWYPVCEKMGGNGPLLANALLRSGVKVRYVGPIGI